jgi:hypothetical protein
MSNNNINGQIIVHHENKTIFIKTSPKIYNYVKTRTHIDENYDHWTILHRLFARQNININDCKLIFIFARQNININDCKLISTLGDSSNGKLYELNNNGERKKYNYIFATLQNNQNI